MENVVISHLSTIKVVKHNQNMFQWIARARKCMFSHQYYDPMSNIDRDSVVILGFEHIPFLGKCHYFSIFPLSELSNTNRKCSIRLAVLENIGLDTKIMILCQILTEIWLIIDLGGLFGHRGFLRNE